MRIALAALAGALSLGACRTPLLDVEYDAGPPPPPDLLPDLSTLPTTPPWPMPRLDPRASGRSPLPGPSRPVRSYHSSPFPQDPTGELGVMIDLEGIVYASTTGSLIAYDPASLGVVWQTGVANGGQGVMAVGAGGRLYKTLFDGTTQNVVTYDAAGHEGWRRPSASLLLVGNDGTLFVRRLLGGTFVLSALSPQDGKILWTAMVNPDRVLQAESGALVVASGGRQVVLDDAGKQLGVIPYRECSTIDAYGRLRCLERRGGYMFQTVSIPDGKTVWAYADMAAFFGYWSEATDGKMVVLNRSFIYTMTADIGLRTDLATLPGQASVTEPPVIDGDGNLYIAAAQSDGASGAMVLSYKPTGELRWSFTVEDSQGSFVTGPLALGRDGTLFYPTCANLGSPNNPVRGQCRIDAISP